MNCWEILGIDPTGDRAAIDQAYEQQKKFAAGEDLDRLQQAYREASGEPPEAARPADSRSQTEASLSAQEQQVVREVAIQVRALLNDSRRSADEGIWRAILTEPPADQSHLRSAIAAELEPQLRPMADNGAFPVPVVAFLGDWFGWQELQDARDAGHRAPEHQLPDQAHAAPEQTTGEDARPSDTSFWPAVVGWVVALAVLAAVFDSISGG